MLPLNYKYRPLPDGLVIKHSLIEGVGLFAVSAQKSGTVLGLTHVKDARFENSLVRTPLGGFINHSDTPNCEILQSGDLYHLRCLEDIETDTELTVDYNKTIK